MPTLKLLKGRDRYHFPALLLPGIFVWVGDLAPFAGNQFRAKPKRPPLAELAFFGTFEVAFARTFLLRPESDEAGAVALTKRGFRPWRVEYHPPVSFP